MKMTDLATGCGLAALGGVTIHAALSLPPMQGQPVGPSAFPMVIGGGLLICGVLIARGVGRGFEAPEAALDERKSRWPVTRTLIAPGLLLLYVLLANTVGFVLMAALMLGVMALALGAKPRMAICLALVAPPIVHLVFARGLRVPLPVGWLPMPW